MTHRSTLVLIGAGALALALSGCATKKFVRAEVGGEVEASEQRTVGRMSDIESQVEQTQTALSETNQRVDQQGKEIAETSRTAQQALDRALAAGKLAEGTLVSETVLSNDLVKFGFERAELNDQAKAALDEFAQPLKSENKGIYIEIQGHTDSSGEEAYNMMLGEQRAAAVRRYLNLEHGLPLHRMSVISYGEAEPAYDNATREGREKNRRVVLVVLK
ncbi:MAG TPA: OmpA family protein [Thermoanaerobaculia bacterium]|nr:OmpA family protein [Thermoanaerobaculia bacterium]